MPLLSRKHVIKVKIETDKGTKVAADQALLVMDLDIKNNAEFEPRKGSGLFLGPTVAGVLGAQIGTCTFKVEMRSNGSAALEPGIAILFQAGGLKDATGYKPVSAVTDQKTISIDVWKDGKKYGLAGAMGKLKIEGDSGKIGYLTCEFSGIWQTPTDEALPAYSPSTTKPMYLRSGTFTIGGAAKKISKFALDLGAVVVPEPDINAANGILCYIITDYEPTMSFDPEAELVADYDIDGIWLAGTEAAIVCKMSDGTDDITITCPKVQYKEIPHADREGIFAYDATGQCNMSSGNDFVSIACA